MPPRDIDFSHNPVAWAYATGGELAEIIVGPVGSGKTFASAFRAWVVAEHQQPSPDGKRRTRGMVVRNTMTDLRMTTIESWRQFYAPERGYGNIIMRAPAEQQNRMGRIEQDVIFVGLDKPGDVRKLLSFEPTWIYFNELREIPRPIFVRALERVGRYLIEERPTTFSGVWGDMNPPDTDHWIYHYDREDTPSGWRFHRQPPAVLEAEKIGDHIYITDEDPALNGARVDPVEIGGRVWAPELIQAAGRFWCVNPHAENLHTLQRVNPLLNPLGIEGYYGRNLQGKTLSEIRAYLQGRYAFVADGKPCIPEYHDESQAIEGLNLLDGIPLEIGLDIGGGTLQPFAVFTQRHPSGAHLVQGELEGADLGVDQFCEEIEKYITTMFPTHLTIMGDVAGDPAMVKRDEIYETVVAEHIRHKLKLVVKPAPTQDIRARLNAIKVTCTRMIRGRPGLLVSKERCPILRKALMGGWHFRQLQVPGEERFKEMPEKNRFSHPGDALGYRLLASGEMAKMRAVTGSRKPGRARVGFNPLGR